jgi:hypothetical protein
MENDTGRERSRPQLDNSQPSKSQPERTQPRSRAFDRSPASFDDAEDAEDGGDEDGIPF